MPDYTNNRVGDVQIVETRGPWTAKSGGELTVLFGLSRNELETFLDYGNGEFDRIHAETGTDIRGIRSYVVRGIGKNAVGGNELHRARTEYVRAAAGAAIWRCADSFGDSAEFVLDKNAGVITPPGIIHTYIGLEDNTELQVVCNTLFIPEDPRTHDTYISMGQHPHSA